MSKVLIVAKGMGLKSTPSKLNLVADLIRGKDVSVAMMYLKFCRKKSAGYISKVLKSAVANAQANYNIDLDNLYVKEVLVGKSFSLRRIHARARGKACRVYKHYGNVIIKLFERI
ncbi:ribosomal protein L22 [Ehrlichia chaffeensis str. Heartland]|uniref:Large ribosomal subunit protein uL22 n=1 Tax=Ehrlichia chaffeensis (strain ATCC CRL-10679 / Arkansas) TaxID=205920 RepID=RL22_EHRCR|nr:50S ribosomal protein L22 [Ehrlichia chaffeensis]Q2GH51.2 RecName: Full=Large ribosomal subunit protein uL22; AltName: Full=50S ribosomal protein L22 [Ehrlichia chaffeensis str. Arkansas]AHX03516.1 ribosomal protein L22 [Ehrlichia chaffeensis str. Heartland]AHX05763.1 ribosomal protein L22 [Ehrlichia chaffeensis str. Jax]AHX06755.1 ribosomal protein L22 [Ehrlichia chaffeensis str. Liberty]AHX07330.1 ribosomal protein L22 [Ehrlichia chaffeensis str. Osceola]AHX08227.1 ribosomal protein L22 